MTNAIELRGLEKHYPGFDLRLDLELPEGCILGLVGENGAGKSTAIKCMLGLARPDGGQVRILGREHDRDFYRVLEDVGVVLSVSAFPEVMNARQMEKTLSGVYQNWDQAAYTALLERLRIPGEKPFRDLSQGNRMKLAFAAALSHRPRLLVLDEPTSGMDPVVRDEVAGMLLDFTRDEGHSVLISSHIVSDLEKLCDYIAFLKEGRLMLCEEKDRLLEEYRLVQCAPAELAHIDPALIKGRRETAYGVSVLVPVVAVPPEMRSSPVSIEELFILMASAERKGDVKP